MLSNVSITFQSLSHIYCHPRQPPWTAYCVEASATECAFGPDKIVVHNSLCAPTPMCNAIIFAPEKTNVAPHIVSARRTRKSHYVIEGAFRPAPGRTDTYRIPIPGDTLISCKSRARYTRETTFDTTRPFFGSFVCCCCCHDIGLLDSTSGVHPFE